MTVVGKKTEARVSRRPLIRAEGGYSLAFIRHILI